MSGDLWGDSTQEHLVSGLAPEGSCDYVLHLYPGAGEAAVCRMPRQPQRRRGQDGSERACDPEESVARSVARSRRTVRRYACDNDLDTLTTLTWAKPVRAAAAVAHVSRWVRDVRSLVGSRYPYLWVAERSAQGLVHTHALLRRPVAEAAAPLWIHGSVDLQTAADLEGIRNLAAYVCKDFDAPPLLAGTRYHAARGFTPEHVVVPVATPRDARPIAGELMGAEPDEVRRYGLPEGPSLGETYRWDNRY